MTNTVVVTPSSIQTDAFGSNVTGDVGTGFNDVAVRVLVSDTIDFPLPSKRLSPQQLYPHAQDSVLAHVLELLQRAKTALHKARQFDPSSEFVQFDQEIMTARALIGRAYNSRELGEGFAAVVNATNWALANREAGSPTKRQINMVLEALNRISWSPYLHFDTAMAILDALEEAGLNIESPSLELITTELDD